MARGRRTMTYAEKIQYHGTAAAQDQHQKSQAKLDAQIADARALIATLETAKSADKATFQTAMATALASPTPPVFATSPILDATGAPVQVPASDAQPVAQVA